MNQRSYDYSRRAFLARTSAAGIAAAGLSCLPGETLAELITSPRMTEGPFYPNHLPRDTDNDLLIINEATVHALGDITHLSGRALSKSGGPLRNAVIEIWQVDNRGAYLHTGTANADARDKNFQGYGRFLTDAAGRYYFRTIKPVAYPGRTPHIHVAVSMNGRRVLTTQFFVKGEPQNQRDGIFRSLTEEQRKSVVVDFRAIKSSKIGEISAECDLVVGHTPGEDERGRFPGVIAQPEWTNRRSDIRRGPDGR